MRATLRAALVFAGGVPLSLAVVLLDPALWPLGLGYVGFAIMVTAIDALLAIPRRRLRIEVTPPAALQMGSTDEVAVSIEAGARRSRAAFEVLFDASGPVAAPAAVTALIDETGTTVCRVPLIPERRGIAVLERLWVRWRGPWGLVERHSVIALDRSIPVIPNVRRVWMNALLFSSRESPLGILPQSGHGDGSEFDALRDYTPGLDHRSIDWKHSARHLRLVCKEFRTERNNTIVLAFDSGHLMSAPVLGMPRLDHAVNAALVLAYACQRNGDRVGMFAFDSRVRAFVQPLGGVHGFRRIQRAAAEIAYCHEETNFTLGLAELATRLNRRALVILQTDFVDTITAELMIENLGRLSKRHLVLFVCTPNPQILGAVDDAPATLRAMTRAVVAYDMLRERRVVLERLQRLGILCLEAPHGSLGADLVNRYLTIKRREMI